MKLISFSAAEELSEEDQKLKSELDMLAERIQASLAAKRSDDPPC